VIGPLSTLDPDGLIVRVRLRFPLVTLWVPVNVWLRSVFGLAELLLALPQPATARLASATMVSPLNALFR
jgi:hypothetical protein